MIKRVLLIMILLIILSTYFFFKHEVESEYSKQEIGEMLEMIDEGNKSSGRLWLLNHISYFISHVS